jgi:hypothetical protein
MGRVGEHRDLEVTGGHCESWTKGFQRTRVAAKHGEAGPSVAPYPSSSHARFTSGRGPPADDFEEELRAFLHAAQKHQAHVIPLAS